MMFTALTALPLGWAYAQAAAPAARPAAQAPVAKPASARLAAQTPLSKADAQAAERAKADPLAAQPEVAAEPPPPPPPPPLVWTVPDATELLVFIRSVGGEGLDPFDYDPEGLAAALRSGDPVAMSQAATDRFNLLSSDLALGHVRGKDRQDWHVTDKDIDSTRQYTLLKAALEQHRVADALRGLLPTHPQYAALKMALSVTPRDQTDKLNRIRLNLDRWRWLPRDLGERYIIVNVPAYTAAFVENGNTISRHHAVAGAIKTPTPQLTATATGVIFNPWWEVPKSIEPEVRGKKGYVPLKSPDGKIIRWRQPPGPSNALGQIKFVMPNPKAIYLHDTNARGLFDNKMRAYSHGCIRTENIHGLAKLLLTEYGNGEWTEEKIQEALASGKATQANFPKPLPIYIVYMSSAAHVDGRIIDYADIYKRDGKVIAALLDRRQQPKAEAKAEKVAAR